MTRSSRRPLLLVLAVVVALAAVVFFYFQQPARTVLAEPAGSVGPGNFTPPLSSTTPTPAPSAPSGNMFSGSSDPSLCNRQALIDYLQSHPDRAQAWAQVEGITVDQIPAYVNSLKAKTLAHDIRVTNHAFENGKAVPRQSVLQAGTVVLVDPKSDQPVTRCLCGNPLLPAVEALGPSNYTGDKWPGFDPGGIIVVKPTPTPSASPSPSGSPTGTPSPSSSPTVSPLFSALPNNKPSISASP